jgi:hypothetical protein
MQAFQLHRRLYTLYFLAYFGGMYVFARSRGLLGLMNVLHQVDLGPVCICQESWASWSDECTTSSGPWPLATRADSLELGTSDPGSGLSAVTVCICQEPWASWSDECTTSSGPWP